MENVPVKPENKLQGSAQRFMFSLRPEMSDIWSLSSTNSQAQNTTINPPERSQPGSAEPHPVYL